MLTLNLDKQATKVSGDCAFVPINELLDFIIDRHFPDPDKRSQLHAQARDIRQRWGEVGYQYEGMAGRVGRLWLKCKNPNCDVSMETAQEAVEGQTIFCPACQVTCPVCGHTDLYDGSDLRLRLAEQ